MPTLLQIGLGNAVVATGLALLAASAGKINLRPALVHCMWVLVLLKLVTPPIKTIALTTPAGLSHTQQAPPAEPDLPLSSRIPSSDDGKDATKQSDNVNQEAPAAATPAKSMADASAGSWIDPSSWARLVLGCWAVGCLALWAVAVVRVCQFRRVLSHAHQAADDVQKQAGELAYRLGLKAYPRVWFLPAAVSPMLWALSREPRLLLPSSLWQRLTEEQQQALLTHELAHWRRRDHWVRLLELLVLGLYWWHPVVWWARRALREAEEQCCDAWVVWALPAASPAYASALVETAAFLSQSCPALPVMASGFGHTLPLRRRLTMIMRGTTPRALSVLGLFFVVAIATATLPLLPTWAQSEPAATLPDDPVLAQAAKPAPEAPTDDEGKPAERKKGHVRSSGFITGLPAVEPQEPASAGNPTPATSAEARVIRDEIELLQVQRHIKQAQLRGVEAGLYRAKNKVQRAQQLAKSGGVSATEVEDARADIVAQEALIDEKRGELEEVEVRVRQAERRLGELEGQKSPATAGTDPSAGHVSKSKPGTAADTLRRQLGILRAELETKLIEENVAKAKLAEVQKQLADDEEGSKQYQVDRNAVQRWQVTLREAVLARTDLEERIRELGAGIGNENTMKQVRP